MLKQKKRTIFTDGWVWLMAWRDARRNFSRLALFTASLITGIAAVVALDSINHSLQQDIDKNARELLGADLVVTGDKKFSSALKASFDSTQLEQASEASMASMVIFPKNNDSRLIRLVAVEGPFPFYGEMDTNPANAYAQIHTGNFAVLDESLASQFNVRAGDSLKLGRSTFRISGVVTKVPGGGGIMTSFTPSVYISMRQLDSTKLVQYGSRVSYKQFFKTNTAAIADATMKRLEPAVKKGGYSFDTIQKRKESLGRGFSSIYRFFALLAFVALILGCIGVASSTHIYAREKREEVALLRCIGTSGWQAFNIYFIQIFLLGVIGSVVGTVIGIGVQQLIPVVLKGVIPFEIGFSISWGSLLLGLILGTVVSVLFSTLPLMAIRFVPPLTVLRADFNPERIFSKATLLVIGLIVFFPIAFAALQTKSWMTGVFFFLGLSIALACLTLVAITLLFLVRRFFPSGAGFTWRHALSNLFRPQNQTRVMMVTIGLGAFIISTLNIVEKSMLGQAEFVGRENQSNTILFDIQPSQREGVVRLMEESKLRVNQVVPIITCRLRELKGKAIDSLQKDSLVKIPEWALTREYRVTYRDTLHVSEKMLKGEIQKKTMGRDSVWVTVSKDMSETLGLTVGDSLAFDVQGVPLNARIAGIREVEWPKDPPNFIFVFPSGVLENAPQVFVTATKIENQVQANEFQQRLIAGFPNVSLIDLRLVLGTINDLFDKLGLVIRFLALFSVVSGMIVLAGAVVNSKFARIKENVLLRTIGARTRQITAITLIEYAYLGLFSSVTGMALALGGGWLLTRFFFDITFAFDIKELVLILLGIVSMTGVIGWYNSREVISTPPLQVLRKES